MLVFNGSVVCPQSTQRTQNRAPTAETLRRSWSRVCVIGVVCGQ
jgi:hypothetical protein